MMTEDDVMNYTKSLQAGILNQEKINRLIIHFLPLTSDIAGKMARKFKRQFDDLHAHAMFCLVDTINSANGKMNHLNLERRIATRIWNGLQNYIKDDFVIHVPIVKKHNLKVRQLHNNIPDTVNRDSGIEIQEFLDTLSSEEKQIIKMLLSNYTYHEIGDRLKVSHMTIPNRLKGIRRRWQNANS